MAQHESTITVRFDNSDAAAAWFVEARAHGLFARDAGLRHADALDIGRARPGDLIVSAVTGCHGFIVEPDVDSAAVAA